MQFGMGPFGEMFYNMPYGYPGYGGYSPYYWGYSPYFSPWGYLPNEQEKPMLEDQIRVLEDQLKQYKERLSELEKTGQGPTPQNQGYWQGMQSWQMPYPRYGPDTGPSYQGFQPPPGPLMTQEQELSMLNNQAQFLKQQMEQIDARIKELEQG